jgi:hypothetical protein
MRCLVQREGQPIVAAEVTVENTPFRLARVKVDCKPNCAGCAQCRTREYSLFEAQERSNVGVRSIERDLVGGKYVLLQLVGNSRSSLMVKRIDVPQA